MSSTSDQNQTDSIAPSVGDVLNEVAAGVVNSSRIAQISDPTSEQVKEFDLRWSAVPLSARRDLVREMLRQADEDLEVNFHRYLRKLVSDSDAEVRALAIRGLWEDTSTSFLHVLCQFAVQEHEPPVQEAVAIALGSFSYLAGIEELDAEQADMTFAALQHLLAEGGSWMVRRRALESIAYINTSDQVSEAIIEWYASDFEQERAGALVAMGRNLKARWLPTVLEALTDDDPDIRVEAARAAGQLTDPRAIDPLARMIDDEDEEIRIVAIQSLGNIGGQKAIDSLRYLRTQADEELIPVIDDATEHAIVWLNMPLDDEFKDKFDD